LLAGAGTSTPAKVETGAILGDAANRTGFTAFETLEEINGEIREAFEHAGGEEFTYIPCLNDDDAHIDALVAVIEENLTGWVR
jgi:hypothetical protein